MGTMLYAKGVFINRCFDSLNLMSAGHRHRNPPGLRARRRRRARNQHVRRQPDQAARRSASAIACARSTSRGRASPAGRRVTRRTWPGPSARSASASSRGARRARTRRRPTSASRPQALVEGGVDLFILETFRDLNEMGAAIAAVRSVSALPIVAQMTIEDDGNSLDGTPPEQFAPDTGAAGRRRHRRQLQHRPRAHARDGRTDRGGHARAAVGAAQRRSARATSRGATSTCPRPSTWPPTRDASRCRACGWSADAAARRRNTSGRSRPRSSR